MGKVANQYHGFLRERRGGGGVQTRKEYFSLKTHTKLQFSGIRATIQQKSMYGFDIT